MKMADALADAGAEVTLIARVRRSDHVETGNGDYSYYGVKPSFGIKKFRWEHKSFISAGFYSLRGLREILRKRPQLVVSRNIFGSWLTSLFRIDTIHESHSPEHLEGRVKKFLLQTMCHRGSLKGVVVISQPLKNLFVDSGLLTAVPILVLPDGATVSEAPRKKPQPVNKRLVAGYAGSLYTGRGIELIARIAQACPWAAFRVAGGNADAVADAKEQFRDISNLDFVGHLAPAEIPTFLNRCDTLLAPYQDNTSDAVGTNTSLWMSPLKIFEYMSAQRPIIASDIPVLGEILKDRENSLLVPSSEVEAWVLALNKLRSQPSLGDKISDKAFHDLKSLYSWNKRAKRILTLAAARKP